MIHVLKATAVFGLVLALQPTDALAGRKRLTPKQNACERSRASVGKFLKLDFNGARLESAAEFEGLVDVALSPRARPLFVTVDSEITTCTADEDDTTQVKVRYQVAGIIRGPGGRAAVSVYFPGKGTHDRVFKLSKDDSFRITNADDIYPHVSARVAASELRKELMSSKNDEERGSLQGAIEEIERL